MELMELYQFVLLVVIVGMILGAGILALDAFAAAQGVTPTAASAINSVRAALATIATNWLTLIITIVVMSIIIVLIVRSFGFGGYAKR